MSHRIIWVDDEIEHLRAHVIFLEGKGYSVETVTNGEDALALVKERKFDIMLLDESMPGMDGLETLSGIKDADPGLPVVMITKNEEERLMDDAIGMKISDFLLKPVSPIQIHSACKRILDGTKLQEDRLSPDYIREFNEINDLIRDSTWESWLKIHRRMCAWDHHLDEFRGSGLDTTHNDQRLTCAQHFSRWVEAGYRDWVASEDRLTMSPDIFKNFVAPHLRNREHVLFLVIDCVRLDQWMVIAELLETHFDIKWDYYLSILPTATPYSRNSIFSGLFPDEIARKYPDKWLEGTGAETSKNKHEQFFLAEQMRRLRLDADKLRYAKIFNESEMVDLRKRIGGMTKDAFAAVVFNFVDILTHGRNQSEILQQLVPDESAFRSMMHSWFKRSALRDILVDMAKAGVKVVMTTDHGSILGRKASLVYGRKDTSTNLRYKFGNNLKADEKQTIITHRPQEYRLPAQSQTKTYLFAKEYYYFVYPTNFRTYEKQYEGSFQHGGVSLEEMVLPVLTLTPRT